MEKVIKMPLIGAGGRGYGLLRYVILQHPEVKVTVICDPFEDRCRTWFVESVQNHSEPPIDVYDMAAWM